MGPRFNGVEDKETNHAYKTRSDASMGPRFNGVEDRVLTEENKLAANWLQWGHALMAWKTSISQLYSMRTRPASMGPRFNGVEDNR